MDTYQSTVLWTAPNDRYMVTRNPRGIIELFINPRGGEPLWVNLGEQPAHLYGSARSYHATHTYRSWVQYVNVPRYVARAIDRVTA